MPYAKDKELQSPKKCQGSLRGKLFQLYRNRRHLALRVWLGVDIQSKLFFPFCPDTTKNTGTKRFQIFHSKKKKFQIVLMYLPIFQEYVGILSMTQLRPKTEKSVFQISVATEQCSRRWLLVSILCWHVASVNNGYVPSAEIISSQNMLHIVLSSWNKLPFGGSYLPNTLSKISFFLLEDQKYVLFR